MPAGKPNWKYLDGEKLFKTWVKLGDAGSMSKLRAMLAEDGVINNITGRPPTRGGIWHSMWKWAVNNPYESRALWEKAAGQYGVFVTDEMWYSKLVRHAKTVLTLKQYKKYIEKNPHLKLYAENS